MTHGNSEPGMSTTAKVIIGLAAAGAVGLVLCCGGVYLLGLRFQEFVGEMADSMTQNPAEIRDMTESMASIEIAEGWQPVMGMDWGALGVEMTMAIYSPNQRQPNRMLMLMQMQGAAADQQQMEQQMRMQTNQQGMNQQFVVQSSETRTFVIDGVERDFLFAVGTDNAGNKVHQVQGVFPGRNGTVMLTLMEDDANWDEEAVVQMIESISTESGGSDSTSSDTDSIHSDSTSSESISPETTAETVEP